MSKISRQLLVRLAICGAIFCGSLALGRAMDVRRERAVAQESQRRTYDARLRAKDALDSQLSSLELMAQNAAANPRLAAALEGGVDDETLRDIFRTEHWWARYRDRFESYAIASGAGLTTIEGQPLAKVAAQTLVNEASKAKGASSSLVSTEGAVYAAAASVIPLATRTPQVLLVAARVDQRAMDAMAARAGGAVAISDGRHPRVIAGDEVGRAQLTSAAARQGTATTDAVGVDAISGGLWLLAYVGADDFAERALARDRVWKRVMWALDIVLTLGLLGLVLRSHRNRRRTAGSRDAVAISAAPGHRLLPPSDGVRQPDGRAQNLGRYILLDQIGEGGMAQIFAAVRIATGGFRRPVVIKRLRPDLATNAQAVSQFIDEANLVSQLVHSNIVPVFDFGKMEGQYYIAEEYIVGRDLGRVVMRADDKGRAGLPLAAVLFAAREALQALDYAHNKLSADGRPAGIVHRDITPDNIMVSARGEVKLLDFGIVKADEGRITKTQVGMVKGSVGFMSPEQARGREVDHRSDLYSVGLLIYTCYTGHVLYQGETTYDLMVKAASGPAVAELEKIAALPNPLPQILLQALAVNPAERFQSAVAFAAALDPHIGSGDEQLATLLHDLFGEELRTEELRLRAAAMTPQIGFEVPRESVTADRRPGV